MCLGRPGNECRRDCQCCHGGGAAAALAGTAVARCSGCGISARPPTLPSPAPTSTRRFRGRGPNGAATAPGVGPPAGAAGLASAAGFGTSAPGRALQRAGTAHQLATCRSARAWKACQRIGHTHDTGADHGEWGETRRTCGARVLVVFCSTRRQVVLQPAQKAIADSNTRMRARRRRRHRQCRRSTAAAAARLPLVPQGPGNERAMIDFVAPVYQNDGAGTRNLFGPTLRLRGGDTAVINLLNNLTKPAGEDKAALPLNGFTHGGAEGGGGLRRARRLLQGCAAAAGRQAGRPPLTHPSLLCLRLPQCPTPTCTATASTPKQGWPRRRRRRSTGVRARAEWEGGQGGGGAACWHTLLQRC